MGLDQNLFSVKHTDTNKPVDQDLTTISDEQITKLGYWRKANHIHGWMEKLYREKGGTDPDFNCATVQLTGIDLAELSCLVALNKLDVTEGFFFGGDNRPEELDEYTLEILNTAIAAIKYENKDIYYTSWW